MKRPLTENQCTLLNYLWEFYLDNDQLPPCHVISRNFRWSSPNAAQEKLDSLCDIHGLLEKNVVNKWKFSEESRMHLMTHQAYTTEQGNAMRNLAKSIVQTTDSTN